MVNQASSSTYPGAIVTFHAPSVGRTFERVFRGAHIPEPLATFADVFRVKMPLFLIPTLRSRRSLDCLAIPPSA